MPRWASCVNAPANAWKRFRRVVFHVSQTLADLQACYCTFKVKVALCVVLPLAAFTVTVVLPLAVVALEAQPEITVSVMPISNTPKSVPEAPELAPHPATEQQGQ